VLPQAIRRVVPPLLNDFIGLQKDTAIITVIGVTDALAQAGFYSTDYFLYVGYTVAAVFFFSLVHSMVVVLVQIRGTGAAAINNLMEDVATAEDERPFESWRRAPASDMIRSLRASRAGVKLRRPLRGLPRFHGWSCDPAESAAAAHGKTGVWCAGPGRVRRRRRGRKRPRCGRRRFVRGPQGPSAGGRIVPAFAPALPNPGGRGGQQKASNCRHGGGRFYGVARRVLAYGSTFGWTELSLLKRRHCLECIPFRGWQAPIYNS